MYPDVIILVGIEPTPIEWSSNVIPFNYKIG